MSIQVLVADDHEVVRKGLQTLLSDADITIVGESGTGEETLRLAKQHNPDVVLLDVLMPEKDGLTTLAKLKADWPDLPVLMLSAYDNPAFIARSVASGANGFILKSATRDELLQAIRTVSSGKTTWTPANLRRVPRTTETSEPVIDAETPLTKRENDVLKELAQGSTYKEIARTLGIGSETVKEHLHRIFRKIGARDRTEATLWAVRKGLI
jgi:DNA-binding NarL/FixJ family response regulator